MSKKVCPLLWISTEILPEDCDCQGKCCAWWVPPMGRREGHCAMQDLAALSLIASEVGKL